MLIYNASSEQCASGEHQFQRRAAMNDHRFRVGQAVEYYPPRSMYAPRGGYHVTAELPFRAGEFEYRIKHPREQCERVVAESDLSDLWN